MNKLNLDIWRLHPSGCRIIPAEKTLCKTANEQGVKWCGPFSNANSLGWWIYPPTDIDITWKEDGSFQHEMLSPYLDSDYHLVRSLLRANEGNPDKFIPPGGRTKFSWGGVESNVVQIWTGCIFKTSPGWVLQTRSPINFEPQPFHIMEGIIETDWMQYDIWLNLVFDQKETKISLRRDQPFPLAQITPISREAYDSDWAMSDQVINRDTEEGNQIFEYWTQYNQKKYGSGGKQLLSAVDPNITKDSTTYFKERKRILDGNLCPHLEQMKGKSQPTKKVTMKPKMVKGNKDDEKKAH